MWQMRSQTYQNRTLRSVLLYKVRGSHRWRLRTAFELFKESEINNRRRASNPVSGEVKIEDFPYHFISRES